MRFSKSHASARRLLHWLHEREHADDHGCDYVRDHHDDGDALRLLAIGKRLLLVQMAQAQPQL